MLQSIEHQIKVLEQKLAQLSCDFLNQFSGSDLPEKQYHFLMSKLKEGGIVHFSRHIRQVICELNIANSTFRTDPFWWLIDTIGFWEDAHPGRCTYSTIGKQQQYLQWVNEGIAQFNWSNNMAETYFAKFSQHV